MQADQANFEDWEDQMVVDRSRGQFFKNLYKPDPKEASKRALRDPQVWEGPPSGAHREMRAVVALGPEGLYYWSVPSTSEVFVWGRWWSPVRVGAACDF